jgi:hypothetical protein
LRGCERGGAQGTAGAERLGRVPAHPAFSGMPAMYPMSVTLGESLALPRVATRGQHGVSGPPQRPLPALLGPPSRLTTRVLWRRHESKCTPRQAHLGPDPWPCPFCGGEVQRQERATHGGETATRAMQHCYRFPVAAKACMLSARAGRHSAGAAACQPHLRSGRPCGQEKLISNASTPISSHRPMISSQAPLLRGHAEGCM